MNLNKVCMKKYRMDCIGLRSSNPVSVVFFVNNDNEAKEFAYNHCRDNERKLISLFKILI